MSGLQLYTLYGCMGSIELHCGIDLRAALPFISETQGCTDCLAVQRETMKMPSSFSRLDSGRDWTVTPLAKLTSQEYSIVDSALSFQV